MAGITSVWAVDHAKDACATFKLNHPQSEVVCADVLTIDPNDLPETDIIVGGPPCVNFSNSKGSRANVLDGLKLVQWFLRVVAAKKPKYWIMENVPGIAEHLPDVIPYSWIGLDKPGSLPVPLRAHFNTAEFGVAQARKRYLVGKYPLPIQTHADRSKVDLFNQEDSLIEWQTLGSIIRSFPPPENGANAGDVLVDPNYRFQLSASDLTDHFINTVLSKEEAIDIRRAKTEHPYMGKMAFPDRLDRPARTVVATQLGRETLVLTTDTGMFRRATIRECASIQSFPITYQFTGKSIGSRYRQAGDAVPPLLAFSIGRRITGISQPLIRTHSLLQSAPLETGFKPRSKRIRLSHNRKFAAMIPGKEVRGSRVELDNLNYSKRSSDSSCGAINERIWSARLHVGEGKGKAQAIQIVFEEYFVQIQSTLATSENADLSRWQNFFQELLAQLPSGLDPNEMQKTWAANESRFSAPTVIVERITELVNKIFPKTAFADKKMQLTIDALGGKEIALRVRLAASAVAVSAVVQHIYGDKSVQKALVQSVSLLRR